MIVNDWLSLTGSQQQQLTAQLAAQGYSPLDGITDPTEIPDFERSGTPFDTSNISSSSSSIFGGAFSSPSLSIPGSNGSSGPPSWFYWGLGAIAAWAYFGSVKHGR